MTSSVYLGQRRTVHGGPKHILLGTTTPLFCLALMGGAAFAAEAGGVANSSASAAAGSAEAAALAEAASSSSAEVSQVIVTARNAGQEMKIKLNKIPGGVSVVSGAEVAKGRVQSNADLLKLQPGVIAEATGAGGLTAIKVSIRGSGVNNGVGYFRSGIKYEYDDLPITTPGGDPYELFDPSGLNYTQVLRGDNAFTTGDLALGGTVNFISNNGRTAPYTELRTEAGSYGYIKQVAATGGVSGPWDYYLMVSGALKDGFQQHSSANTQHISASLGYQVNPNIETRLYFHYGRDFFNSPGALTKAQIEANPSQAQLSALETGYHRLQPGSFLIGDVTKIRLSDTQTIETGIAFQNYPIVIYPSSTSAPTRSEYYYGDLAAQVKYGNTSELFGHRNDLTVAAYWSDDIYGGDRIYATADKGTNPFGTSYNGNTIAPTTYYGIGNVKKGLLYRFDVSGSTDAIALVSDDFEAAKNVWLTLGGGYAAVPRHYFITGHSGTSGAISSATLNQFDDYFIPRVGLRWDVSQNLQLFTSYGGNVEPKQDWQGAYGPSSSIALYPNWGVLYLKPQVTNTFEAGFRGHYGIFSGSADYFRSDVHNELISITDPLLKITTTLNAPPATHEGVEVALDTLLWQGGDGPWDTTDESRPKVHFTQVYNWSNFHYNGTNSSFKHNEEPGLPKNYYQGELAFQHPNGFYGNFDVRYSDGVWIDYMNTFKTNAYTTFGLTVGWQQRRPDKKGWQVSFSVDNLTNTKYAVAVAPTYNANHSDAAVEYPGDGRGYFGVLDYKF